MIPPFTRCIHAVTHLIAVTPTASVCRLAFAAKLIEGGR